MLETIDYLNLQKLNNAFEPALTEAVVRVTQSGWYLLGQENERFAAAFAQYCGVKHCVPVGNGLDALTLVLMAYRDLLGWTGQSEVMVPANTYIATILAITRAGLKPVLCEPDEDTMLLDVNRLEEYRTEHTVALMPVHLYGRLCDMLSVNRFAKQYQLKVIEDAAQAHGARNEGLRAGAMGDAAGFSFYPGKNLGALGDAGCVTTDDEALANRVKALSNYGSEQKYVHDHKGINSRMDEVQAAVLQLKLEALDKDNRKRREIARRYLKEIRNPRIILPMESGEDNVWHIFPIRCEERDALQRYLRSCGVQTLIHYPIPPHKQLAYKEWNDLLLPITERIHRMELSIPLNPIMTRAEVTQVIEALNDARV